MNHDLMTWSIRTGVAVLAATLVTYLATWIIARVVRSETAHRLVALLRWPVLLAVAVATVRINLDATPYEHGGWVAARQLNTLAVIVAAVWVTTRVIKVLVSVLMSRFDIETPDNLRARSVHTQVQLIRRVANVVVILIGAIAALLMFPWGRQVGASVLAAGGIIGVVLGVTGRSTIGNVVAGVQVAFAEPIRLEDVVIVEDEWGNIEEITLTYVVVRLWDHRRLVVPTSYFVENPFQNWTRRRADITGAVELWVDYSTPVPLVREQLARIVTRSPHWDGRSFALQVTDTSDRAMKLRALISAADAPRAFDLRCEVREGLVAWLAEVHPDALPQVRVAQSVGDDALSNR